MSEIASQNESSIRQRFIPVMKGAWIDVCAVLLLAAGSMAAVFAATTSGLGMSPDSVTYFSMAANLRQGLGFVSNLSGPFDQGLTSPVTTWPPGYSLLIAGPMLFGIPAWQSARVVGVLCLAVLLGSVYWLGQKMAGRLVGILSAAIVLTMMPVLRIASFALSEMPFALFTALAACGFVQYYRAKPDRELYWIGFAALSTALAVLTRYVGLIFVIAGLVVLGFLIALKEWGNPFQRWLQALRAPAAIFFVISAAPILPWFIRNQILTGHFSGYNRLSGYHPSWLQNLRDEIGTLVREILPSIHLGLRGMLGRPVVIALITAILLVLAGYFAWAGQKRMRKDPPRIVLSRDFFATKDDLAAWCVPFAFTGLYIASASIITSMVFFPDYDWPRYLGIIYPLLILVLVGSWDILIKAASRIIPRWFRQALFILPVALVLVFYAVQSAGFISQAAQGQELTSIAWRENQGIAWLAKTVGPRDIIFSAKPEAISYYLDRPARYLPYQSDFSRFLDMLMAAPPSPGSAIYLVAFKGDLGQADLYLSERLSADDLKTLAVRLKSMQQVADLADATIYRIGG